MIKLPENLSEIYFRVSMLVALVGSIFLFGVLAGRKNLPPVPQIMAVYGSVKAVIADQSTSAISEHLQPSRGQGAGVTINAANDDDLVFMVGFFDDETQARLLQRDGTLVRKWSLDYEADFPDRADRACKSLKSLDVDVHGALLNRDGELVFNYEYCGTVKLDACGTPVWSLALPTHHSIIPAEAGGYWALNRHFWKGTDHPDRLPPFSSSALEFNVQEDTLLRLSEDGAILEETSIPQIMVDSGLGALLTATGDNFSLHSGIRAEIVHANKVAELPQAIADQFPLFSAGDLAISMRELNLVMVVDAETKAVKWHQTGPWIRQHDPEFRADGRLSVFNNNVYRIAYTGDKTDLNAPRTSNIMAVDPVTRRADVLFGERPGQEMLSIVRGQHELRDDGGMVITEFDAGRVLEVDPAGAIIWEYVNAYDDSSVGELTNAAVYPRSYFRNDWQSCQATE